MPYSQNVELVRYHDLDRRPGFKLAMQEVQNSFYLYVGALWQPGWSIVDVTDPESPRLVRWIEGPPNNSTTQVQVADGRMITSLSHRAPEWVAHRQAGEPLDGFYIWDITTPDEPVNVGHWVESGSRGTHHPTSTTAEGTCTRLPPCRASGDTSGVVDIADPGVPTLIGKVVVARAERCEW